MSDIVHKLKQAQELLDQGRFAQARDLLQRVVRHAPADRHVNVLMRHALSRLGEPQQALYYAEQALRSAPEDPELVTLHAMSLADCGKLDEALARMEPCVKAHPESAVARATLARMYGVQERLGDCLNTCLPALQAGQQDARILSMYAAALLKIGRAEEAVPIMKHVAMSRATSGGPDPMQVSALANAILYDHTAGPADAYAAHYAYGRVLNNMVPPPNAPFAQSFDPERKLRIGFVSPDLRTHPSHRFLPPVLENIDRERHEVFLYSTAEREDANTETYKALATQWRSATRLSVRELARKIHEDRVDVLFDMAGHMQGGRLLVFHLRPAPVQALWMGYPCTSGVANMDYRITDSLADPAGFENQSTEKLVRIDPCFMCYRPPEGVAAVDPTPPSAREGARGVTFVSFNAIQKVNTAVIRAWARVLKEVRGSRLIIRHRATLQADVREHIVQRFAQAGAPRDMLVVEAPVDGTRDVMAAYNQTDIALDTFPFPGITTTCEALWMGVPVVCMEGVTTTSRSGLFAVHAAGLGDLVAKNEDEFVAIAARLAADVERRRELRRTLRDTLEESALRDEKGFTRKFENAIRGMWRERCASAAAAVAR